MKRLLVLPVLALALTACSDTHSEDGNLVTDSEFTKPYTVQYNNAPLYCVAQGHGLSCDWVRYHQENGF